MIAAEIQQRDEALTAAGHDPECAAFDDRECSCGTGGFDRMKAVFSKHIDARNAGRVPTPVGLLTDQVILEGDHARAYRRWTDAMRALGAAKTAYAAAGIEAQAAHEALAQLSVGSAP